MKKFLFSAVSMLLMLGSCSQNELEENVLSKGQNVVTATIEGQVNSRLSVSHDETTDVFSLAWSTGDAFKVFGENNGTAVYTWSMGDDFSLKDGDTAPATPVYAIYPNSETDDPSIAGNVVTMTLKANPSIENVNLPMWAGAPNGNHYAFKHLAAALQFSLSDIPAGYDRLIVEASKPISGTFTATLTETAPVLKSTSTDDNDKKVTVSFTKDDNNKQNQVFYVPLPAVTYESLNVSVSNGTDTKELKSWTNLTVVRGKMYYTTAVVDASSVEDVNSVLANAGEVPTTVNLTAVIDASEEALDIPDDAKDVTLNFGEAPTTSATAPLVINQNESAQVDESNSELNINMPTDATGLYAEINAPTTTATLNGGKYAKVTAKTATNTLIIKSGVEITNLVINGGNVVIEEGATVATIQNAENFSDKTYVIKKGALTNTPEATNIILVSNESEMALRVAAENGGDVMLTENVELTETLEIPEGKTMTIDLNGHKITTALSAGSETNHLYAFDNKGTLTIMDTDTQGEGEIICRGIYNYGKLTLESGTIDACDGNGGYGVKNCNGSEFIMNGGVVETSNEDDKKVDKGGYDATPIHIEAGATATIYDGKVNNVCDFTLAVENYGTLTVEKGTFTSVHTTVGNFGTMKIKGGSFTCSGLEGVTSHAVWADAGELTIEGGTFDGKDNYNGFNVDASAGATVYIEGGKFLKAHSGSLYGEGTISVSGGEFFDACSESVFSRLADEASIVLGANMVLTNPITIAAGKTVTLDLNGKTLSQTSDTPVSMITNSGNLTIKDSSNGSGKIDFTFNGTVDNGKAANAISNRGTLVVEGGVISNTGTGDQIGYAIDNYNGSTLTVDGGKITASGSTYYDGIRLFCGSNEITVTVNNGTISTIWAQNPSDNKASEVEGTVIINGGTVNTIYYENYTTVKVKTGVTATVTPYGAGKDNTTTTEEDGYTIYSFVHNEE